MALIKMVDANIRQNLGVLGRYALCDADELLLDGDATEDALAPLSRFDVVCLAIHSSILHYGFAEGNEHITCCGSVGGVEGFDSIAAWPRALPRGWRRGLKYRCASSEGKADVEFTIKFGMQGQDKCVVHANKYQETVLSINKYFSGGNGSVTHADVDECLQSLSQASGEPWRTWWNKILSLLVPSAMRSEKRREK